MAVVDVHAHVLDASLRSELQTHMMHAGRAGVRAVIGVTETTDEVAAIEALLESGQPAAWAAAGGAHLAACVGLHPVQVDAETGAWRSLTAAEARRAAPRLRSLSSRPWVVGIGECGLDFTPRALAGDATALRAEQEDAFREQCRVARECSLPLNVHSRNAGHHALRILTEEGCGLSAPAPATGTHGHVVASSSSSGGGSGGGSGGKGDGGSGGSTGEEVDGSSSHAKASSQSSALGCGAVLHAFDGRAKYVREAVERGFFFSVPPSVERSPVVQKWVKTCPLDRLLLETDSPALPAVKGETNVPANVTASLGSVARLQDRTVEEVAAATTANALRLFPKLLHAPPDAR